MAKGSPHGVKPAWDDLSDARTALPGPISGTTLTVTAQVTTRAALPGGSAALNIAELTCARGGPLPQLRGGADLESGKGDRCEIHALR
jgi:hypothetical protein